jgi:RNA recognition motif-containing protein
MKLDPLTGRNMTYCFLEYLEVSSAHAAMKMEGFELAGRKIKVRLPVNGNMPSNPTTATTNPVISNILKEHNLSSTGGNNIGTTGESNSNTSLGIETKYLIIKNIHSAVTQEEIKSIFGVFGNIKLCYIISIEASTRTGFIEFELTKSCQDAVSEMENFSLAGNLYIIIILLYFYISYHNFY